VVWPAPSWKQRACQKNTAGCSSHGVCTWAGECVCDAQYFGSTTETPCDSYCFGEISASGQCHYDRVFYIGGLVSTSTQYAEEIISTMRLAVELINNYTDGWFDSTRQVTLVLRVEDSRCSMAGGEDAIKTLNDWAVNVSAGGTTLDGVVGALCSDSSKGAARFGNTIYAPQLSYYATSVDLSDKDEYIYFGRTCYTNDVHGQLLVEVMEAVGIVPFVAVVHGSGDFLESLAAFIVDSYEAKGHTVLQVLQIDPGGGSASYQSALDELAAVGAPATVLVLPPSEVEQLISAAAAHPVYRDDSMVWVGIENWVDRRDQHWNRQGMLGIVSPYVPSGGGGVTADYMALWQALDPEQYVDGDGDRASLYEPTLFAADAVFALALAFQQLIEEETGLQGDLLKKHTYTVLTQQVSFEGVSGPLNLQNNGNRDLPVYGIVNYGDSSWIENGYVDESGTYVLDYSALLWPDNSTGKLAGNWQQELHCPAGTEPLRVSADPDLYSCAPCDPGEFKSEAGSHACSKCPDGTACAEPGVVIPCISAGFWRAEPPPPTDSNDSSSTAASDNPLGDFHNYKVYSCDVHSGCLGGCNLNDTCSSGRVAGSVSCGVCSEGLYLNLEGKCLECTDVRVYSPTAVFLVYAGALLSAGLGYFLVVYIFSKHTIRALERSFERSSSSGRGDCGRMGGEELGGLGAQEGAGGAGKGKGVLFKMASVARTVSVSAQTNITKQNFRDVMITGKIVLAFLQVMGTFFLLDLSWSSGGSGGSDDSNLRDVFTSYNVNVFRGNEHVIACSDVSPLVPSYYFIVLNAFFLPLVLALLFGAISVGFYQHHMRRVRSVAQGSSSSSEEGSGGGGHSSASNEASQQARATTDFFVMVWTIFSRITLWLCLLIYPSVSSIMLSVFNCRDFGNSGTFLRVDNSISCEDAEYRAFLAIAVFGVVLYIAGIPFAFYYAIRHRQLPLWSSSSSFLHHGFADEWKYFEIFDLLRKLLITSVSQFVASPSSPTQVLFLLLVDLAALFLVSSAQPYLNNHDDHLSSVLTFIECCAFLFAFLLVSGVSESEGYDEVALSNTLLSAILLGLLLVTPCTFVMKIEYFKKRIRACVARPARWMERRLSADHWRGGSGGGGSDKCVPRMTEVASSASSPPGEQEGGTGGRGDAGVCMSTLSPRQLHTDEREREEERHIDQLVWENAHSSGVVSSPFFQESCHS
jgi:ABC-type branched-subunit amino acid transport system substrate-binding protein